MPQEQTSASAALMSQNDPKRTSGRDPYFRKHVLPRIAIAN
jgi:hypothetical protein